MFLEELVGAVRLEDDRMECKARLDRQKPQGWLKTICGFANAEGGTLFLGVEDKTGKLLGFERREADNERNYLNNQINEHISPQAADQNLLPALRSPREGTIYFACGYQ